MVHSVLHLLGYDHLDEGVEKARMRARRRPSWRSWGLRGKTFSGKAAAGAQAQEKGLDGGEFQAFS